MGARLEVDDTIVLLLGSPSQYSQLSGRVNGITRLEKLVFLIEQEGDLDAFLAETAEFEPHNFGPFSKKIYQAVETLEAYELLVEENAYADTSDDTWENESIIGLEEPINYSERKFVLTEKGRKYYDALVSEVPPDIPHKVGQLKDRFGALPLRQLLRFVYTRYEDYTTESVIKDQILG